MGDGTEQIRFRPTTKKELLDRYVKQFLVSIDQVEIEESLFCTRSQASSTPGMRITCAFPCLVCRRLNGEVVCVGCGIVVVLRIKVLVLSIDKRVAPQHPYPTEFDYLVSVCFNLQMQRPARLMAIGGSSPAC